ncbi:protein SCAR2-like isoform X2 [Salvia miltiorrhiza]|nr:protein SCAR2-like isoform X2 [Salvia miltiorrhiza]
MDSYEECRGPPRLFLLDKFDVAGAGASLKRYTDPSFFKVETSAPANANVQREKKIRKAKKKGPRARYGGTPETLQASSHAKLHQLLLEECVENGVTKPAYRARLKRRPNAFPFNSKSGKSYMEELLKNPSPEHNLLHEITVSSPLQMSIDDQNESVLKLRSVGSAIESEGSKSNPPFADREEIMPNPSSNQRNDASTDIKTYGVSSLLNILTDDIPSTSDEENSRKDIAVDGESKLEGSLIGYQSDGVASEIDNYVDAPSTMESEMDTDSELRVKNKFTLYNKNQPLASVKNEEHCHSLSLDSQSTGDFSISDEGNSSYKKEISSSLSSDSPRTSAENPRSEKLSADIPEFVIVNASSIERNPQHFSADDVSKPVVSNNTLHGNDVDLENRPDVEQPTSSFCSTNSGPPLPHYDSRAVAVDGSLRGAKSDEIVSNSDDDVNKRDLILDSQCSPSASHSKSLEDDSQRSSSGEHLFGGEITCVSPRADISHHTSGSLDAISAYVVHEDDYDQKDQFANKPSTVNMDNIIYQNRMDTEEIISKENPIPGKLDNKVAQVTKSTDNFANGYIDIAHDGDNVASEVSEGDERDQSSNFYNEDPNVVSESFDSEDHCSNQISTGTLILSGIGHPPVLLKGGLVTCDKYFTPEGPTTINGTSELGNLKTSEVMGLQIGITDDVNPSDLTTPESSFCMPENLEDSSGISYTTERDGVNPDSGIAGVQLTEVSSSASLKLPSEIPESLDELYPSTDQSENARMACSIPAISDNTILENVSSPAGLDILVEEHVPCSQDLGLGVIEDDATSLSGFNRESQVQEEERSDLSGSHSESGLVEEVDEREAAALDFAAVCGTKHDDHPKPELSHNDFRSYLDSEVKHRVDMVNASQILTPLEQSGLDTEEESLHQSGLENLVSDVDSLHIGSMAEESILPENIELHSAPIDNALPDSSEILSSELSVFPASQLQMLDHDNDKGFDNFASSFPPPNCPPSMSVLPGLRDYGTDASAYPKDPSGFMFPPEVNQMNLHQSPSLPPLPPLQWRIGKLQHASSTTEEDKMDIKKVFPEPNFPLETSTGYAGSVPQQTKESPSQSEQITIKEENLEHGCPSLEANAMHKMTGLPQEIEYEQDQAQPQQQLLNPTKEKEIPSPAEEVEVAEGSQMVKLPVQIVPQSALKEEHTEHCSPTLEADSMDQAVHPPPEVETTQQKQQLHLVLPVQESVVPSPAVEDGVANGHRTIKLPRTCNPVIGSVAALDKSRLRKVTEEVRPQKQKQDERDALLDQIRAKSFNLKPTATTRPSIQGPNTNLKVAAILEKANAIRQALAGSDEDEDSWSDS